MKTSQNGDIVVVQYVGKLDDGTVFDQTDEKEPANILIGANTILPEINNAFIGMQEGEEKQISIAPEDAFGKWEESNVRKFSLLLLDGKEPEIGQVVKLKMEEDTPDQFGKIVNFGGLTMDVDLNHPLAGQTLNYMIKVVKIVKKDEAV